MKIKNHFLILGSDFLFVKFNYSFDIYINPLNFFIEIIAKLYYFFKRIYF